jgi:hypothetical protein
MEFNLDFLRNAGEALSSFGKKEEDKDYSNTSKEDQKSTAESVTPIVLKKDDDEKTIDESTTEVIKTTEDKKKESASDLEKKLANIEKVIDTFGGSKALPTGQLPGSDINANINQRPLDMGQVQAKAAQAEYLKPSTVPEDRIALLYEDLKKYNLI